MGLHESFTSVSVRLGRSGLGHHCPSEDLRCKELGESTPFQELRGRERERRETRENQKEKGKPIGVGSTILTKRRKAVVVPQIVHRT